MTALAPLSTHIRHDDVDLECGTHTFLSVPFRIF